MTVSAFLLFMQEEVCRHKAELEMKDMILQANRLVEWVAMADGPNSSDNNDVWDWEGNNTE